MTRPQEPTWPTVVEAINGSTCGMPDGDGCYSQNAATRAIELCRKAWLASVDDPSADLLGTVRTSPDGIVVARTAEHEGESSTWRRVSASTSASRDCWFSHPEVRGWTFTCNIPGTPAWDAAQAVSS